MEADGSPHPQPLASAEPLSLCPWSHPISCAMRPFLLSKWRHCLPLPGSSLSSQYFSFKAFPLQRPCTLFPSSMPLHPDTQNLGMASPTDKPPSLNLTSPGPWAPPGLFRLCPSFPPFPLALFASSRVSFSNPFSVYSFQ